MDQQIYNRLVSFIWSIANDCLVDIYEVGDYRKVILPMMVIRRFDGADEGEGDGDAAKVRGGGHDGL